MKNKFIKIGIPIIASIIVVAIIIISVIVFTVNKKPPKKDDELYIKVEYSETKTNLQMDITTNKEVSFVLTYVLTNKVTKELKTTPNNDNHSATYIFEKKDVLYTVSNLALIVNEQEVYRKENLAIFALAEQGITKNIITGYIKKDLTESIQIGFNENEKNVSNIFCVLKEKENEISYTINSDNSITVNKNIFTVGNHEITFYVQSETGTGTYTVSFNVSNDVYAKNIAVVAKETFYKNIDEITLLITVENQGNYCQSFFINGAEYYYDATYISPITQKRIYEVKIPVIDNTKDELNILLEKVKHKNGEIVCSIPEKIELKTLEFEIISQIDSNKYFEGEKIKYEIVLNNPLNIQIDNCIFDNQNVEINKTDSIINVKFERNASTIEKTTFNYIEYTMYNKKIQYLIDKEYTYKIISKITSYSTNNNVLVSNDFVLDINTNKTIDSEVELLYFGTIKGESFTSENTTYSISENHILIDFSNYLEGVGNYSIFFSGLTLKYGTKSYAILENELCTLKYVNLVYEIYNFEKDDENHILYFNIDKFENVTLNTMNYILYDEDSNIISEKNSRIYPKENSNNFYISNLPSNATKIKIISVNCTYNSINKEITSFIYPKEIIEI